MHASATERIIKERLGRWLVGPLVEAWVRARGGTDAAKREMPDFPEDFTFPTFLFA